eukprot:5107736-Ditylum_brightwellii.AAC.2
MCGGNLNTGWTYGRRVILMLLSKTLREVTKLNNPLAVRWVTGQDKSDLLQPTDTCSKTGLPVEEVLLSKHPSPTQPLEEALYEYDTLPALIDINVTEDTVESVVAKMQGATGPGSVDSIAWRD